MIVAGHNGTQSYGKNFKKFTLRKKSYGTQCFYTPIHNNISVWIDALKQAGQKLQRLTENDLPEKNSNKRQSNSNAKQILSSIMHDPWSENKVRTKCEK